MKHTAFVVSHTHWDREWYLPFQRFQPRLVAVLDELLNSVGVWRSLLEGGT